MENPELLFGIPLVLLGLLGILIAASLFAVPAEETAGGAAAVRAPARAHDAHPGPSEYVVIGLILGMITAVEVALYYIDLSQGVLVTTLLVLSAAKFGLVVLWFMHLKFDSPLLSRLFGTGFFGAIVLFAVVMATLGANLV
ncbi:MAG: cytochrome C oxidase subunit IV family protein [Dehalococcoidia bacterium]